MNAARTASGIDVGPKDQAASLDGTAVHLARGGDGQQRTARRDRRCLRRMGGGSAHSAPGGGDGDRRTARREEGR